ncbi:MAG: hypothetical protein ACRD3I_12665, partial [Terriglobales bacterium]
MLSRKLIIRQSPVEFAVRDGVPSSRPKPGGLYNLVRQPRAADFSSPSPAATGRGSGNAGTN